MSDCICRGTENARADNDTIDKYRHRTPSCIVFLLCEARIIRHGDSVRVDAIVSVAIAIVVLSLLRRFKWQNSSNVIAWLIDKLKINYWLFHRSRPRSKSVALQVC